MSVTLGVDVGSHGARAVVVRDGGVIAKAAVDYETPPPARRNGDEVWRVLGECVRSLPANARREITALGTTGVRGAVVGLGDDGTPATPVYPDFDAAAVETARALSETFGGSFLAETGCPLFPLAGLPKMVLPTTRPVRWWLGLQDYAAFRLTGHLAISAGSGLRLGILDSAGVAVNREVLARAGVDPIKLPPVAAIGATIGSLSRNVGDALGLPEGLPVVACPGDVPAGFIAAGPRAGMAFANLGTTTVVCRLADDAATGDTLTREILDRGRRSNETGFGAGGITFDWLSRLFEMPPTALEEEASAASPSNIVIQPELLSPWGADVAGAISGISARDGRGEIVRAAYRAVARRLVDALDDFAGAAVETLVLGGGGASSDLLCHEIAQIWKGSLERLPHRELAAEGAAAVAAGAASYVNSHQLAAQ
jgi:sugar (pentulose or hexulose) kinase